MILSNIQMDKYGIRFVSLFLFCIFFSCFINFSESKRSACWRYGHSCWGGHGKRNGFVEKSKGGTGLDSISTTTSNAAIESPRVFGMLDKTTGHFSPFPILSLMMSSLHSSKNTQRGPTDPLPPVGLEKMMQWNQNYKNPDIIPPLGVQRSLIQLQNTRNDPDKVHGDKSGRKNTNNQDSQLAQQKETESPGTFQDKKEENGESRRIGVFSSFLEGSSQPSPSSYDNSIFVRNRKELSPSVKAFYSADTLPNVDESQTSNESMENSGNEEHSQENIKRILNAHIFPSQSQPLSSSLVESYNPQSQSRFLLWNKIFHNFPRI